jgi:hypothetical protein
MPVHFLIQLLLLLFTAAHAQSHPPFSVEFSEPPALFKPLRVRLKNLPTQETLLLQLESRPLDVLPGREEQEWQVIVSKSVKPREEETVEFGCEWITATGLYRVRAREEVNFCLMNRKMGKKFLVSTLRKGRSVNLVFIF